MKIYFLVLYLIALPIMRAHGQNDGGLVQADSSQIVVNLSELPGQVERAGQETKELLNLAQDTTHIESYKNSIASLEASVIKTREQSDFFLQSYARPWLIQNLNAKWIRLNDDWVDLSINIEKSTENVETRLRTCQEMISKWREIKEGISGDSVSASLNKPVVDLITSLTDIEHLFQEKIKVYLTFQERVAINRAEINRHLEILMPLRNQDFLTFSNGMKIFSGINWVPATVSGLTCRWQRHSGLPHATLLTISSPRFLR